MRTTRMVTALAAAGLAIPASASSAYAPSLAVSLDPAKPERAPALTVRVVQASEDTPSRTIRIGLPDGFGANRSTQVVTCAESEESAGTCPDASRLGTATAETAVGNLSGGVHLASSATATRIVVFLRDSTGIVTQKLVGTVQARPDGGLDLVLGDLPQVTITSLVLDLAGGGRSLFENPAACGRYTFTAEFLSHAGEIAEDRAPPVAISGCSSLPRITRIHVRPRRFHAVREAADRRRPGHATRLSWIASETTGGTKVRVHRRKRGRWRRVGAVLASGEEGKNVFRFEGRLRGSALKPGRYRFVLVTRDSDGQRSRARIANFRILR
jgi:hypothetical protein